MSRPKIDSNLRKVKINLTISSEAKQKAEIVRQFKGESLSKIFEEIVEKEYKSIIKKHRELEIVEGQLSFKDLGISD